MSLTNLCVLDIINMPIIIVKTLKNRTMNYEHKGYCGFTQAL